VPGAGATTERLFADSLPEHPFVVKDRVERMFHHHAAWWW
jgi:hypothetical protein